MNKYLRTSPAFFEDHKEIIMLNWTNPATDFNGVRIQRKVDGYPSSPGDGTKVHEGAEQIFVNHPVENNIPYYYKACSCNSLPLYSNGVEATATPICHCEERVPE